MLQRWTILLENGWREGWIPFVVIGTLIGLLISQTHQIQAETALSLAPYHPVLEILSLR